jgi:hypothetical protein
MANDTKSSIIKEALTDYNAIREAADANAKKKLAEEFPEKFQNLLKEELQNKNKKGYKKIEEPEENKDTVMKKDEKETKVVVKEKAGEGKPFTDKTKKVEETAGKDGVFTEKPKKAAQVEEDVKITDTVGDGDPFDEKAKKGAKIDEEREKDFTADVEAKTPNIGKGEGEKKAFTEKPKNPTSGTPLPNLKEEFDVTGLEAGGVGSAIEGAQEDDEILTMEEIEREIANMESLGEELDVAPAGGSQAYNELLEMRNKLDEVLKGMGEQKNNGGQGANQVNLGGPTNPMIDEKGLEEMHAAGGEERFGTSSQVAQLHNGNPMIDEEPITDADVEAVLGAPAEAPVDEHLGITHANNKKVTATLPSFDNKPESHKQHTRSAVQSASGMVTGIQETQKKMTALIEENKKLTKRLNETKKYKESVGTLVEGYKSALDKYRNQLKEMAIFNTNLAHVNNLLVNEELALTQDDKIKIINEFKKVDSIATSQAKYKAILTEMKEGKKTLTESVERKVTASVASSSKQKLDEVVEKTAYADDKHIQRMRKLIEYTEHRGKKIIK